MTSILIDLLWLLVAVGIVFFAVWAIWLVAETISGRMRARARRQRRMTSSIEETAKKVRELERLCAALVLRERLAAERDEVARRMAAERLRIRSKPG